MPRKPLSSVTGVMPAPPSAVLLVEDDEEEEAIEDDAADALSLSPRPGIVARPGWTRMGHRCAGRRGRAACSARRERGAMACEPVPVWNAMEHAASEDSTSKTCEGQQVVQTTLHGVGKLKYSEVLVWKRVWAADRSGVGHRPKENPQQGDVSDAVQTIQGSGSDFPGRASAL